MDAAYLDRLVDAFTALQRRERRTDLDFAEITRRASAILGREIPSQTVGRWMRGKVQPRDPQERKAFAAALGTTVGALFYAEDAKNPASPSAGSVEPDPSLDYKFTDEDRARDEAVVAARKSAKAAKHPRKRA